MAEYFVKDGDDYQKVDEDLIRKSSVEDLITKRLDQQRRNEFKDFDDFKKKAEKYDSETTELNGKLESLGKEKSELEKQLSKSKLDTEKIKLVNEFKLSEELAEFVEGDTPEELRKRAEKLAKGSKAGGVKIDKKEKPESKQTESKQIANKLFGKKSDD